MKYGEGLDKKQVKADLDPTTAKPSRSMREVLAQLKLKHAKEFVVCHHCGKVTRSLPTLPQPVAALRAMLGCCGKAKKNSGEVGLCVGRGGGGVKRARKWYGGPAVEEMGIPAQPIIARKFGLKSLSV